VNTVFKYLFICLLFLGNYNTQLHAKTLAMSLLEMQNDIDSAADTPINNSILRKRTLLDLNNEANISKTLRVKIVELKDSTGLVYLGALITKAELTPYLTQMKTLLGNEFSEFRQNQMARDHHLFHFTVVNPYEYQTINKTKLTTELKNHSMVSLTLHGLGSVGLDKQGYSQKSSYYVVASSSDAQFLRQNLLLKRKDFHVTLGFNPQDIYDQPKGLSTLIIPQSP